VRNKIYLVRKHTKFFEKIYAYPYLFSRFISLFFNTIKKERKIENLSEIVKSQIKGFIDGWKL